MSMSIRAKSTWPSQFLLIYLINGAATHNHEQLTSQSPGFRSPGSGDGTRMDHDY